MSFQSFITREGHLCPSSPLLPGRDIYVLPVQQGLKLLLPSSLKVLLNPLSSMMCLKPISRLLQLPSTNFLVSISESRAEAFVCGKTFVFECRVPTNISYNIPKVESSYVLKELKAMSANKATGLDGITSCSSKAGAPVIYDSLAFIMNLSIYTGIFINDWKVAK